MKDASGNPLPVFLKANDVIYEDGESGNYSAIRVKGSYEPEFELVGADGDYEVVVDPATAMTAGIARFHWKVTYYATNDSVVLEPLNAARHTYDNDTKYVNDASTTPSRFSIQLIKELHLVLVEAIITTHSTKLPVFL